MITLPNNKYTTDVLTQNQLEFLAGNLPSPKAKTGRPAYANEELLPGILKVLRSGSRWRDLDRGDCPSSVTHWRRLRFWQKIFGLESLWQILLELLFKQKKLDPSTTSIDGTLIPSFSFKDTTSYSGKHKRVGTKVSLIVGKEGLPLAHVLASGSTHDCPLAIPTYQRLPSFLPSLIQELLADKGYHSSDLRSFLGNQGIAPNISQRRPTITWQQKLKLLSRGETLRPPTLDIADNPNKKRFVVERTNAWTKSFRRLKFRFDYSLLSFSAFLNLAFIVILVRRLIN